MQFLKPRALHTASLGIFSLRPTKSTRFNAFKINQFKLHPVRRYASFKELAREYGPVALGVYGTLAFITYWGCFLSITYLGITQDDISAAFNKLRSIVGMKPEEKKEKVESDIKWLPEWAKTPKFQTVATNLLLALLMTKLFSPIKIGITAALTPPIGKRLKAMGWIGQKKL
ncbi:hypothetical protein HK103_000206 [Boothiomyces macroporosus]|uniref:DUF1279 domain-containing protein n=1 Tax=Boothiomyces macroporosus TaxID=261099 RepID=A0AAD5YA79_9FUNG|nr:hypothetical protein HK103_000206 [Boothiomyces macroporosus]